MRTITCGTGGKFLRSSGEVIEAGASARKGERVIGNESGELAFQIIGQRFVGCTHVGKFGVASDRWNFPGVEQRGAGRQIFERTVRVPERVGLRDCAAAAFFAPNLVVQIEVETSANSSRMRSLASLLSAAMLISSGPIYAAKSRCCCSVRF